jgi:hypothetical protein
LISIRILLPYCVADVAASAWDVMPMNLVIPEYLLENLRLSAAIDA